jgi:hypothetical protein
VNSGPGELAFTVERQFVNTRGETTGWAVIREVEALSVESDVKQTIREHTVTDVLHTVDDRADRVQYRVRMRDAQGTTTVSDVVDVRIPVTRFAVQGNYPNPFQASTTVEFDLPAADHVDLHVFDLLGREVARVLDANMPQGRHRVTFDARDLAPGMYVGRLRYGGQMKVIRMVVVR